MAYAVSGAAAGAQQEPKEDRLQSRLGRSPSSTDALPTLHCSTKDPSEPRQARPMNRDLGDKICICNYIFPRDTLKPKGLEELSKNSCPWELVVLVGPRVVTLGTCVVPEPGVEKGDLGSR